MKFERKYLSPYHCRICGIELTDTNWKKYNQKASNYICVLCYNKSRKEYRKNHLDRAKELHKLYYDSHKEQIQLYRDTHKDETKQHARKFYLNTGGTKKIKCIV